ncbi:MAG: hypothetical protein OEO20_11315 [Gemmatimonadota bacterium]|nr:hypothetical protein [Gemmatimonadota bacterium]MDH3291590.1 hypothetical protein [Gemmatimonadota bacterium]MDH3366493.1 hypothetical protein [Gemmatimonadota bacterium]MDH3478882.1 hypothetical protein [Gemmatimonadota bacterium]MDH3570986.1 hypothetical protein [Gemmatimonadota bacterium]
MYVKLFGSILDSSVWMEDIGTRIVWITMLAMANEYGIVEASTAGLAHRARVNLEECKRALEILVAPDIDSKDQSYGGRRVEKVEGGWLLLNYEKYREMRSRKQIMNAQRQSRFRRQQRDMSQPSVTRNDVTVEAEADVEADAVSKKDSQLGSPPTKKGESLSRSANGTALVPAKETAQWVNETLHDLEPDVFDRHRLLWEARTVFAFWSWRAKKNGKRVVLTEDRKTRLRRYLQIYGLEDCLLAVEGAFHHADHNQQDGREYHELEHIFKRKEGGGTVEKLAAAGTKKRKAVDKILARLAEHGYIPTGAEDAE